MSEPLTCFFFLPGLSEKYRSGGLLVIQDIARLLNETGLYQCIFVTTHEIHPEGISPAEAFQHAAKFPHETIFIVTWGSIVEEHISMISRTVKNPRILYYAQSFGWNFKLPKNIPIACVSRFVMNQWTMKAPENFCMHIPPPLAPCFTFSNEKRDIDILVHTRKQNSYCLKKLIPALQKQKFNLKILSEWILREEFANLFKRTKLFLYLTGLHKMAWNQKSMPEGFGLPALEAVACGTLVGSNLLGGVTDFLIPFENCVKLQSRELDFDIQQIKYALENMQLSQASVESLMASYQQKNVIQKWEAVFQGAQQFEI